MLNRVKSAVNKATDYVSDSVKRFKNRDLMQATVAVCARVALADGEISSEEKQKMIGFLQQSPELNAFGAKEVIDFFESLVKAYEFDAQIGKGETMKHILTLKDSPDMAQLAVRVGIAVANSDGHFDDDEKREMRDIIAALGLTPSDFEL